MEEIKYKVYVKMDSNNCITSVESTCFNEEEELLENGYIQIDKGSEGTIYAHAQPNYLVTKYGQPITDLQGNYNYKLVKNKPVLLTTEEKELLFPKAKLVITAEERLTIVEEALQEVILGGM